MAQKLIKFSVNFAEDRVQQLDTRCLADETTRSAIIREALSAYLDGRLGSTTNFGRLASISEFTQAAVDVLIREQAPDRRDEILATVDKRMERYHAQG